MAGYSRLGVGLVVLALTSGCARTGFPPVEESSCSADSLQTAALVCRPATDPCDLEEFCDGVSTACPTDEVISDGLLCPSGVCNDGSCETPVVTVNVIDAPAPQEGAEFGDSFVLIDGLLAVGAPHDSSADIEAGMVYLFSPTGRGEWLAAGTVSPTLHVAGDRFGEDLAISGDRMAVGADRGGSAGSGKQSGWYVLLFIRVGNVWVEEARLPNPEDPVTGVQFGNRVALEDDTLVVVDGTDTFIYTRDAAGWVLRDLLPGSGRVALDGNRLVLTDLDSASADGRVFLYERIGSSWLLQTELVAIPEEAGDYFGWGLAMRDDSIFVGAPGHDGSGPADSGSLFEYRETDGLWTLEQILKADVPQPDGHFGETVGVGDTRIIVGSPGNNGAALAGGAAYIFQNDGQAWTQSTVILPNPASADDQQGNSWVSLVGSWAAFAGESATVSGHIGAGRVQLHLLP